MERRSGSGSFVKIGETDDGGTVYLDESLSAETEYFYRVRAVSGTSFSPYSAEAGVVLHPLTAHIPEDVKFGTYGRDTFEPVESYTHTWDLLVENSDYPVFDPLSCAAGEYYVGFKLSYDLGDADTETIWDTGLEIRLQYDQTVLWTKPLYLNAGEQTFLGHVFHDEAIECDQDYRFVLAQVAEDGSVPDANVRLSVQLHKKFAEAFSPAAPTSLDIQTNQGKASVSWDHAADLTRTYELEWVFIASHEGFSGNTAAAAFAYKEPVRINTRKESFSHHLYYPEGKVWYRVRAVGYHPDYPEHRIPGAYAYGPDAGLAVSNPAGEINWQLQTVFAEDGRHKNAVAYMDGSLRQRQQVTHLDSEELALVGESHFDFEGRPSVQVLPVPATGGLGYRETFSPFSATVSEVTANTSANRIKFHYDNGGLANSPLSGTSGAGQYYSPSNTVGGIHRDYIPDAEGYAYSHTEYTNDGTGRVRKQSGVGETFRTDGGHSTRFYYGDAAQEELIRLFGVNVGKASHYAKELTVDPNSQGSITYKDQEGRVVATALGGNPPENTVDPLEIYTRHEAVGSLSSKQGAGLETNSAKTADWEGEMEAMFLLHDQAKTEVGELSEKLVPQMAMMNLPLPSQAEYDALMALYQSTNGANWTNNTGWRNADPQVLQSVQGWHGVTVYSWGGIRELALQENKLTGTLPGEIEYLTNVTVLGLHKNTLSGSVPTSVGNLTGLTFLNLSENSFSGTIPPELGNLTKLTNLAMFGNQFSGIIPETIGNLTLLTELRLESNQLSGTLPAGIGLMPGLVNVSFRTNRFTGPIPLTFQNLNPTTFDIRYNFFDMESLLTLKDVFPSATNTYNPQNGIDSYLGVHLTVGDNLQMQVPEELRVNDPGTSYRWYKSSSPVSAQGPGAYTFSQNSLGKWDGGNFTYRIYNTAFPNFYIFSQVRQVME